VAGACEPIDPCDPNPCGADEVCVGGLCRPRPPLPGEVIFSEILYDPHDGLEDEMAEWLELQSLARVPLDLTGCVLSDAGGGRLALATVAAPRAQLLFARSADPARNGGLVPVATFGFALNNGPETLRLTCGEQPIDQVAYTANVGGTFPPARRASISLDPGQFGAMANDAGASWCLGQPTYTPPEVPAHRGTPGGPNPPCPMPMP
jgi:hypothetical protein